MEKQTLPVKGGRRQSSAARLLPPKVASKGGDTSNVPEKKKNYGQVPKYL